MTKKYDYQLPVVKTDEAMELLGYTTFENFKEVASKYAPNHVEISPNEMMFSVMEIKAIATGIDKVCFIPDEIKERCLVVETEVERIMREGEEEVQKRLEHPYMEDHKCLEPCDKRDNYGYCKAGDYCPKYGVNTATNNGVVKKVNDEIKRNEEEIRLAKENVTVKQRTNITDVQDILMGQLHRLVDPTLTQKERENEMRTAMVVSNVSKNIISSFDLQLRGYGLMAVDHVDRKGIKALL